MTSYFQQEIHATFCERQFWNQKASLIEGSLLKPQSDQLLNRLSIRTCLLHFPTFSLYNNTKQFPKNLPKLVWLPCQDCLEHNLWLLVLPFFLTSISSCKASSSRPVATPARGAGAVAEASPWPLEVASQKLSESNCFQSNLMESKSKTKPWNR